ncbi:MAG: phosphoribosylamine--glycine ligase, partial [Parcubacteria group bacterium Gr01-1014_66]
MNILVVGNGGREHAFVWKMRQSSLVKDIFVAPGNAGMKDIAVCVDIDPQNVFSDILTCIRDHNIDLTVIGPEDLLLSKEGIVNVLQRQKKLVFGPLKSAALIEGSKAFACQLMKDHGVLTPDFHIFSSYFSALDHARHAFDQGRKAVVIKVNGLAAGKGVRVCRTIAEAGEFLERVLRRREFGSAGSTIIFQEYKEGIEFSLHALCDGKESLLFPLSQDYKARDDGGRGPNTGGMGAYMPAIIPMQYRRTLSEESLHAHIVAPLLRA